MAKFGKELVTRTISGAVMLAIVVGAIMISEFGLAALALTICIGTLWEFYNLAGKKGVHIQKLYPVIVGGLSVLISFLVAFRILSDVYLSLIFPLISMIFAVELFHRHPEPFVNITVTVGGLIYATLPMSLLCFVAFYHGVYDPYLILCYIFTVWINDIFAYLTGITFGRHKLLEHISPKKSWEGFFGGLIFAVGFGVLCGYLRGENLVWWGGLALVIVLSGVLGDLVESMFKRSAAVKDSGDVIPGHGGFMDRFDALIFSVPFVFAYFTIFAS